MTQTQRSVAWLAGLGMVGFLLGCNQSAAPTSGGQPPGPPAGTGEFDAESGPFAGGKKVLAGGGCFRCHAIDGVRGSGGGPGPSRGPKAPDLGKVGRDPSHSVEWLMKYIRNPKAVKDDAKMPPFEGKIKDDDLRALAEYLASLK